MGGLMLGGLYAIAGLGFSVIWGVLGVVNLAQGSLITLGAYVTYYLTTKLGMDPFLTVPLSMVVLFALGYATQIGLLNRVLKAGFLMSMIVTFGIGLIVANGALLLFGADYKQVPFAYSGVSFQIGGLLLSYTRLGIFGVAVLLTVLTHLFLTKTKLGVAIQATALNKDAAQLVGVNTTRIYALTFALGLALAGAAGTLASTVYTVFPLMGDPFISQAFAITVLGGMGSVHGALVGGLILGLTEVLAVNLIGPGYQQALAFVLLVLFLIFRPTGIFGRKFYTVRGT